MKVLLLLLLTTLLFFSFFCSTVSGLNCSSTKTINIFNTIGEKVLEKQFDSKEITIDLSNNAKGIYYVNVSCGDKQANEKIVIY